jgi:ATPase family AAA domain-containing protein 2
MVDVLQGSSSGLSLRTRHSKPSYRDPNSSDDAEDFEETVSRPSRSRAKGVQQPPPPVSASKPETAGASRPTRSSRYASRLEQFEQEADLQEVVPLRSSSRRSSSHRNDSLSFAVAEDRRSRRNSHAEDLEEESEQRYPRRSSRRSSREEERSEEEEEELDTSQHSSYPRSSRRSSRSGARHEEVLEEEDDEEEDEEEEEEGQKKYSLRDRNQHKRETLNVSHLGGDGQSYLRSTKSHREKLQPQPSMYREPPRVYLGGKIPTGGREKRRSHGHSHRHSRHHKRRHFDSSSDSSDESGSDRDWERRKRRRGEGGYNEDTQFREHEEERMRREMASIMPLSLGGRGGGGMGGSVLDKASRRDIARADVTPIAVDPSVGFASVGGLDKHVKALKEMVVLPLLYPDVFQRFDTQPPRGVLFVGPPGTGKTLTARYTIMSFSHDHL